MAIYKSLSGTVNVCGNECPNDCLILYFLLFNNNLDEPNKEKICVKANYKEIKNFGDYFGWNDGTFSSTCELYRYPKLFYNYAGNVC